MTKRWIVMDLDGTLCDCSHRVHWAQARDWDQFHAGIQDDKPYPDAVEFLRIMSEEYHILVCTGRDDKHGAETVKWLHTQGLSECVEHLLMRPNNDWTSDHELKIKLVDEFFGGHEKALENVLLVLDDRDRVVQAFRDAGFRCWQVAAGAY